MRGRLVAPTSNFCFGCSASGSGSRWIVATVAIMQKHWSAPSMSSPAWSVRRQKLCTSGGAGSLLACRPKHQRRGRRGRWLIRHGSDSQVRLQVAADRLESKHNGTAVRVAKRGCGLAGDGGDGGRHGAVSQLAKGRCGRPSAPETCSCVGACIPTTVVASSRVSSSGPMEKAGRVTAGAVTQTNAEARRVHQRHSGTPQLRASRRARGGSLPRIVCCNPASGPTVTAAAADVELERPLTVYTARSTPAPSARRRE